MNIDDVTGNFAVTAGTFTCGDNVATYPSIYDGCHYGNCSPGTNLPMPVSLLQCVTSSWSFVPTNTGLWDAAYDIWFSTTTNTSGGYGGGAELMIWMDYMPGTGAGGTLKATNVSIDGHSWNVYEGPVGWNYIAYLAVTPFTSFDDANILAFISDSEARGYILPGWYLAAIEAGNELRTGGVPFTSTGFSANVNSSGCGTPTVIPTLTFTPTATPTITDTPCMVFGNTCTPTFTFTPTPTFTPTATQTPTPTPSNLFVVYPNPWPDSQSPGDNLSFYYQNDQAADQVQLKIFTLAYRKIYEDDTLPAGVGPQPPWSLNASNLHLANGLYYFVLVWKNGSHETQKVMKVLIRR